MRLGHDLLVDLALRHVPAGARVADLGGPAVTAPRLASRRVVTVRADEAMTFLEGHARDPLDAVLAVQPTHFAPLMPFLVSLRGALAEKGCALVCDLVWQTAPTPELLRAFAPPAGAERVRPVEGYEMQLEHAGFEIVERADVGRGAWAGELDADARAALQADDRGAARFVAWVLEPGADGEADTEE